MTLVRLSQNGLTTSGVSNTSQRHSEDGVKAKLAGRVVGLGRALAPPTFFRRGGSVELGLNRHLALFVSVLDSTRKL